MPEDKYEIGTRLWGFPKKYIKSLIFKIAKKFDLEEYSVKRVVPHFTYVRPFSTNNEAEVIGSFNSVLRKYADWPLILNLKGFGMFENPERVFYVNAENNESIQGMASKLNKSLEGKVNFFHPEIKLDGEKSGLNLHCSIVSRGVNEYTQEIQDFLEGQNFREFSMPILRVYLLKNRFILREFDFYREGSLDRFESLDPSEFSRTLNAFERKTGFELTSDGIMLPKVKAFS